jgi:hypothetical protein
MKTLKYARLYDEGKSFIKDDRTDSPVTDLKVHQPDRRTDREICIILHATGFRYYVYKHILTWHTFEFNDSQNRNVLTNAANERLVPKIQYNQLRK